MFYSGKRGGSAWVASDHADKGSLSGVVKHSSKKGAAERALRACNCECSGYMSPADLMSSRGGCSRTVYAAKLGISLRALEDYEYARRPIPENVRLLAGYIIKEERGEL